MKSLIFPLLAVISFTIPVFANHSPSFSHKSPIGEIHPWIAPAIVLVILAVLGLISWLWFLSAGDLSPEEREAWVREKKLIKKEKLISYGHDMKVLEEVFREIEIEEEEEEEED